MRFRADQHLRRASDFQHVRTQGRRYDCGAFVLFYAPRAAPGSAGFQPAPSSSGSSPATPATPASDASRGPDVTPTIDDAPSAPAVPAPARAGFVASRSAVGNAVARARAKRRLRERFRAHQLAFPPGLDLVFVARRNLNQLEPAALEQRFLDLCRKLFASRDS
jgi:ribonuclease P protein component